MSRKFSQVPLNLWRNPTFRALPDDAMVATLFFWSGPHSTSAGISVVPDAYAAADLQWELAKWIQAREAVQTAGLIHRDSVTETVMVVGFFQSNRPANLKHRAAIVSQISSIDCDALRELAEAEFARIDSKADDSTAPAKSDISPQLRAISSRWKGAA